MPLQFTLKNAGGSTSMTAGLKNTLTLLATNAGRGSIDFTPGAAVSQDRAASGPSAIYLNFGQLLDDASAVAITPAPGWKKAFFTAPSPVWVLTPERNNPLMPQDSLRFTVEVVPVRPGKATVIVDYYKTGGTGSAGLDLNVAQPHPPKELRLRFEQTDPSEHVIISRGSPRIANPISVAITNPSWNQPLVPPDAPKGATPQFMLRIVTGTGHGALTTAQLAKDIQVRIGDQYENAWKIEKNDRADPPFWTLTPQTHEVLGTGAAATLQLTFDNVVTELDPGLTPIYLEWKDVPDYLDGSTSLQVQKSPRVTVAQFETTGTILSFDGGSPEVPFTWTVDHATAVTIGGRRVAASPAPARLTGSARVRVGGPGDVTLEASGAGRGNVAFSDPITFQSIVQYLHGKTFRGTRGGEARGSSPSGFDPMGWQQNTEAITYSLVETLRVTSPTSATYSCSLTGSDYTEIWVMAGMGAMTWELRKGSSPLASQQAEHPGTLRISGTVVELASQKGGVLTFDFSPSGRSAGTLKLRNPLFQVSGVIVKAATVATGPLTAG